MKKIKSLLFAALLCVPLAASADVEINETNFPDEKFRAYLLEQDFGVDGIITQTEIEQITYLGVRGLGISSLKGIEHFTAMTILHCNENQLTSLDVSSNAALRNLLCNANLLTALDVSRNLSLVQICCSENQIKGEAMDALISSLPALTTYPSLQIYNANSSNEGNICTKSQVAAAKAKGWTPYYYYNSTWAPYEGMDDEAASIALPEIENGTAEIYNLAGQKVSSPVKGGVYVVGGKKVIVK